MHGVVRALSNSHPAIVGGAGLLAAALLLGACVELDSSTLGDDETSTATSALNESCVLGDGFVIPHGSNHTSYPVTCGSDCNDYPSGGFPLTMYCQHGLLGESNPALTGGSVAPYLTASQYNGYSMCTALPNPWRNMVQSADRKTCIQL
jgi:hypothetical protein